jgi:hypothetical protein
MVSQEYTAKVLNLFHDSPRSNTPPRTLGNGVGNDCPPFNTSRSPSAAGKDTPRPEKAKPVEEGRQTGVRAPSTPKMPTNPHQESLSALLQLGPQDSPTDVLRRLSIGLANGTIKLPETPELKAIRMPSLVEAMPEWRLSFAAPKRASSLNRGDAEVRQALKTLNDRVDRAKVDRTGVHETPNGKHVGLFSNLDPGLLQYLSRYDDEEPKNKLHAAVGGVEGGKDSRGPCKDASDLDTRSLADTHVEAIRPEHHTNKLSSEERSQRCNTGLESEKESVHLFDMRISQRLAFTSVLPTTSPSSTNLSSNQGHLDRSSPSFGKLDRLPTFVGQTSAEHLRKPSDPGTRRLFEPDSLLDGRKLRPKWMSTTSPSGLNHEKPPEPDASRDDASSVYLSDAGFEHSDMKSTTSRMARPNSRRNPESFAVAGRQGTLSLLPDQRRNSTSQVSSTEDASKELLSRRLSDVRGKESRFSENFDLSRKKTRAKIASEGTDTLANEKMSMIDCLNTANPEVNTHEGMSAIEFVGALNQRLTSSIRKQNHRHAGRRKITSEASGDVLDSSVARDGTLEFASGSIDRDQEPARTSPRGRTECATNMWERALRRARDDPGLGTSGQSFGSSFGQLRRNHSLDRRHSRTRTSHHHDILSSNTPPVRQSRSLSPNVGAPARARRESFNLDKHQLLCAEAKRPLAQSTSSARSIKTKNRSLLDIRRSTIAGHLSNNKTANPLPATATFPRDFLAWARFPSHTRHDRNGPASEKDGVLTRDFSPPTDSVVSSSRNHSKLSLMTQPDVLGVHTPGSWRFLKFGHARKRSRSMNFPIANPTSTEKEKEKVKKKSSLMSLTLSLTKLKRLYRSHPSDLRRLRAGHCSSLSKGGKVDFPELNIVPGYDGGSWNGGKERLEEPGNFEGESRRWMKQRERRLARGDFGGSPEKKMSGDLALGLRATDAVMKSKAGKSVDAEWMGPISSATSSLRERMKEQTPTKYGRGAATTAGTGEEWAEIYQNCVVRDHDNTDSRDSHESEQRQFGPGPGARLLNSEFTTANNYNNICQLSESATGEGEDSYVSCSVAPSDDLDGPNNLRRAAGLNVDGSCDFRDSDRLAARKDETSHQGEGLKKLLSSELRDSTVDFRMQLEGEERRAREELLRRVVNKDGEDG